MDDLFKITSDHHGIEHYSAPHSGGETSRLAAEQITEFKARACHERILHALRHGPLTREQIEEKTGLSGNTVRPRCKEMLNAGLVVVTDRTGFTESGRPAERIGIKEIKI